MTSGPNSVETPYPPLQGVLDGLRAAQNGDFSTRLGRTGDPLMDEIATVFNSFNDQLALFTSEITRVGRDVGAEGKLGSHAQPSGLEGTWKDAADSVNSMADNITGQVRDVARVATAVAQGDLSQKITVEVKGEMAELKETLNIMVGELSAFADDVTRVAREVGTEGRLGGQARVPGVGGTWRDLTDSVNLMATNLTGQVRDVARVATAVARGDLSQKITVDVKGEMLELKETLNTMVDQLSVFADEVTRVAREVGTEGNLGGQARVPHVAGTWKDLTENVNSMASNLTSQVRNIAQVTTAVAGGDLSRKIDVDARGEILELKTTINTMVDQLSSFAAEVTRVAKEVGSEGRLGGQAEVEGVSGTWKRLTENVNELAANLTRQVRAIAEVTSAVATGDMTRSISVEARGEVADLKDNINTMVRSLRDTTIANNEHDWLQSNLTRMASLMQGQRDLTLVAELIMDELIPLIGAQHGAFFLAETTESKLTLVAGYGLHADPNSPPEFAFGQSLIGQAAKSQKPIVVSDVPADYVTISSGLGESGPVNLIVLPIVVQDQVLGVIEASSFTPFTGLHQEFMEQLMEIIGVNVRGILTNSRTDALLAESQRLAGELQSRTGELQSQQEELQRSNADLEDKAAQLARQKRDIELKNVEIEQARQELEDRARQLDQASRYKSQFLANMSHELRTPLNSLLILARLLSDNPGQNLTAKQVEYARVIYSSGTDLLHLINDILDLSRVEAGKLELHPERFAVRDLVEDLRTVFAPLTSEKGLRFVVRHDPRQASAEVFTDRQRLRQILHNLLANAVKFTEHGHVELRITERPADGSPGKQSAQVAFAISDTGIGISEQNLSRIFGAFQQGDGTTSRRYGGTGLGLAICQELAGQLGGRVTAASVPGEGSTFTLNLPVELPSAFAAVSHAPKVADRGTAPDAITATAPGLRGMTVLVVDDDQRNAFAITSILEMYGFTVLHASDGRSAIDVLQARNDIAVVLMDVMMPEFDGYEAIAAIRRMPGFAELPIIAVTARAMHGDRDKSIEAGANDYVTKPVDADELLDCIEQSLGSASRR